MSTDGQTPLEMAVHAQDWEAVRALIGLGCDLGAPFKGMPGELVCYAMLTSRGRRWSNTSQDGGAR